MEEESRQRLRVKVAWPVTIQTEEGTIERVTYNISSDGAFIRGLSPLELHEVVDMTISAPDHPITVKARVVWSSNQIPPDEDMPRGVGVEFIKISDEDREIISSFGSHLDFAVDLESSISDEDEEEQSLIEEQLVEEETEDMNKTALGSPKKCPCGHVHISWSADEDYVYCWDCNRKYTLVECFGSQKGSSSVDTEPKD
ncbi:MAG: PilZ domain-containing protein [Syntrophobacteria bacterium]